MNPTTSLVSNLIALDATALRVYLLLAAAQKAAGDNVRTYRKDLAKLLNRSERTITRAVTTLRAKGLVHRLGRARYGVRTK